LGEQKVDKDTNIRTSLIQTNYETVEITCLTLMLASELWEEIFTLDPLEGSYKSLEFIIS